MEAAVRLDVAPLAPPSPAPQTRGVSTSCPTDVLMRFEKTATAGRDDEEGLHLTLPTSEWQDSPPTVSSVHCTAVAGQLSPGGSSFCFRPLTDRQTDRQTDRSIVYRHSAALGIFDRVAKLRSHKCDVVCCGIKATAGVFLTSHTVFASLPSWCELPLSQSSTLTFCWLSSEWKRITH